MGNYLQKSPAPLLSGGTPANPGSPATAGYFTFETVQPGNPNTAPKGWHWVTVPTDSGGDVWSLVPDSGVGAALPVNANFQVAVWHPPRAAVAPVPGSPPVYPPNAWDSGAQSLTPLTEDGEFTCTIDTGAGIAVGFSTTLSLDPKAIGFGFLCQNGFAQPFENVIGQPTVYGGSLPYAPDDVWTLRRRNGVNTLLRNGSLFYTAVNPVRGLQNIQASLWAPGDTVRSAALTPYSGGTVAGRFLPMTGLMGRVHQGLRGSFRPLAATITARGNGGVAGSFRHLDGIVGIARNNVRGEFLPLTASISSGAPIPRAPNGVNGQFLELQADLHGLTGEIGGVDGSFRYLDGMLGRAGQGRVAGEFLPLEGRISANPPDTVFIDSYASVSDNISAVTLLVVNIDSAGVATDAYTVEMSYDAFIDSAGTAAIEWTVGQVDSVNIDSSAIAHDGMALGAALGPILQPGVAVWVLNVDNSASTRYENFTYTSLATREGRLYGTKADGVYLLEGPDDAGTKVRASVATGILDFADPKDPGAAGALKRIVAAYLGVAADKTMYLKVVAGGQEFLYRARSNNAALMQQRVDPGRGLRSTYYSFEVFNSEGSDFDLQSLEFVPIKLPRRIP